MELLLWLACVATAFAQCTLTGVNITQGTTPQISFTGMTGAGCPSAGGGASLGPVTIDPATGDIHTPGGVFVGEGSGQAGALDLIQGTAPGSFPLNAFSLFAPGSIPLSYQWEAPSGDAAGCISSNGAATPGIIGLTPCSGGGTTSDSGPIEAHTASSSTSLDFTHCISSTFDEYRIELENLIPSTVTNFLLRVSSDGGATWDSGAHYAWSGWRVSAAGTGQAGANADSAIVLSANGVTTSAATGAFVGRYTLFDPQNASIYKRLVGLAANYDNTVNPNVLVTMAATYASTNPVNAFQITVPTGVIVSGTARCYGVAK